MADGKVWRTNPRLRSLVRTAIIDLLQSSRRPLVLGICGAQGSGKSTLAAEVALQLRGEGLSVATMSLDDLYLTQAEREALARDVHPLLRTRGVPGTHDVALGLKLLGDIDAGRPALIPRFDKLLDDRLPMDSWERIEPALDVFIFEGWCVGARPQGEPMLRRPINALERDCDADGRWRRYVNARLAGPYQQLFARIDFLALLAAPCWDVVVDWRLEQENDLLRQAGSKVALGMNAAAVARFVQHYQRLTCHILDEMPARANITVPLRTDRSWDVQSSRFD
jgi:D-glycerate 3-kinase